MTNNKNKFTVYRFQLFLIFLTPASAALGPILKIGPISPFVYISGALFLLGIIGRNKQNTAGQTTPGLYLLTFFWVISVVFHEIASFGELNEQLKSSIVGLSLLFGISMIRRNPSVYFSFAYGMLLAWCISFCFAFAELFLGYIAPNSWNAINTSIPQNQIGLTGLFTNPNNFAFFLLLFVITIAPLFVISKNRIVIFITSSSILISGIFLWLTQSRTGYFLALVLLLVSIWIYLYSNNQIQSVRKMLIFTVFISSFFVIVLCFYELIIGRPSPIENLFSEATIAARLRLIESGVNIWSFSPVFGVADFELYINKGIGIVSNNFLSDPHNGLLEILSEFGIFVFFAFILFLVRVTSRSINFIRTDSFIKEKNGMQFERFAYSLIALVVAIPIITTMHSTFLGAHTGWLYLASIVVLDRSISKS